MELELAFLCPSELKLLSQEHFSQLLSWLSVLRMRFSLHGLWKFFGDFPDPQWQT